MFFVLLAILIVFIIAFIVFVVAIKKMTSETFIKMCSKKVKRIAKGRKLLYLNDLELANFDGERILVDHIIFGEKYIYLITDFLLKGFVNGRAKDNSWLYYNTSTKKTNYLNNIFDILEKNSQDFAGILGISTNPFTSICVVPNECDFDIKENEKNRKLIVRFSSLRHLINTYEKERIGCLNKYQLREQYESIEIRNRQAKQ